MSLSGFEVAPGEATVVAHVPETVDLGRVRTGSGVDIGDVDAVDRHAVVIPVIDEAAQVARLPAEGAGAVEGEGRRDGGCYRAAGADHGRGGVGASGRTRWCRGSGRAAGRR